MWFAYMPNDIGFGRDISWTDGGETKVLAPSLVFDKGNNKKIGFTLLLNEWGPSKGPAPSDGIEFIEKLAVPVATGTGAEAEKAPPLCTLSWGSSSFQTFKGYLENYNVSEIIMAQKNTVLRASIAVSFIEYRPAATTKK